MACQNAHELAISRCRLLTMRLLQLTTIPETLEAFLLPFAEHFRGLGWTVEAGAREAAQNARCVEAFDGVHDIGWSRNPLDPVNWRALRQVRRLVEGGAYDVVHVHTPVASFFTRLALRSQPTSSGLVYTAHGFHFHEGGNAVKNRVFAGLEKMAGRWTHELVVINRNDYYAALDLGIVDEARLSYVPGIGFDAEGFRKRSAEGQSPESIRDSIGVARDATLILMVAEFTPNKRQLDAVEAFSRLQGAGKRTQLVFVGAGSEQAAVRERARSLGVSDSVLFLGYRRDVPQLLSAADVLLLLSEREGLPVSVLEAMAVGVPVIGTDVRGTKDLLSEGAGLLVPVRDPDAVAAALRRVIERDPIFDEAVRTAAARLGEYSIRSVLASYEDIYSRAIKAAQAQR